MLDFSVLTLLNSLNMYKDYHLFILYKIIKKKPYVDSEANGIWCPTNDTKKRDFFRYFNYIFSKTDINDLCLHLKALNRCIKD